MVMVLEPPERPKVGGKRTLTKDDVAEAINATPDLERYGNPALWVLIGAVGSEKEGWSKSTMALAIPDAGCLVRTITLYKGRDVETCTWVPGVEIGEDDQGHPCLQRMERMTSTLRVREAMKKRSQQHKDALKAARSVGEQVKFVPKIPDALKKEENQ